MEQIGVFFGGKSCEHNISIITGMQTIAAASVKYSVVPVYIDNEGVFWTGKALSSMTAFTNEKKVKKVECTLFPSSPYLYSKKGKKLARLTAAVLCTHGFGGEDGSLQGLLAMCGIPYTGSSVLASSIGMNKWYTKKIFKTAKLPQVPFIAFSKKDYKEKLYSIVENVKAKLRFPLIVKPASLGSSIGISVAKDFPKLFEAINLAFMWDNIVVVENALESFSEYNCAVLGQQDNLITSEVEEPLSSSKFLSFEDKYVRKGKSARKKFPADIPASLSEKIKKMAKEAFIALGASGVARVDFLYKDNKLFVNEINTIPGALSNYLFSKGETKLSFPELIDSLIQIAKQTKKDADSLSYVYKSSYKLSSVLGSPKNYKS